MSTYVWCEDSKSGYHFWKEIFGTMHPDYIVEAKKSNTRLREAARQLSEDGNTYFLVIDTALDNPDVQRELMGLKKAIAGKTNIRLIKVHSFEYALLSFNRLEQWVFAEEDELKEQRRDLIHAKDLLVELFLHGGNAEKLSELKSLLDTKKNTEQIASRLLFGITRNTGFETDKSKLGKCFVNTCCEWIEKQADDICGLNRARLSAEEKKKQLVERSVLKAAFKEAGL